MTTELFLNCRSSWNTTSNLGSSIVCIARSTLIVFILYPMTLQLLYKQYATKASGNMAIYTHWTGLVDWTGGVGWHTPVQSTMEWWTNLATTADDSLVCLALFPGHLQSLEWTSGLVYSSDCEWPGNNSWQGQTYETITCSCKCS